MACSQHDLKGFGGADVHEVPHCPRHPKHVDDGLNGVHLARSWAALRMELRGSQATTSKVLSSCFDEMVALGVDEGQPINLGYRLESGQNLVEGHHNQIPIHSKHLEGPCPQVEQSGYILEYLLVHAGQRRMEVEVNVNEFGGLLKPFVKGFQGRVVAVPRNGEVYDRRGSAQRSSPSDVN